MRLGAWCTALVVVVLMSSAPLRAQPVLPQVRILATGRLLGYFRAVSPQPQTMTACPAALEPDARMFEAELKSARETSSVPSLVLGMGENFAPEYLARVMEQPSTGTPGQSPYLSKDRFVWDWVANKWIRHDGGRGETPLSTLVSADLGRGRGYIPADNVACFFSTAGFDVLVPGKHDFYFGPERLRMLARLLATPSLGYPQSPPETRPGPVQMLAANLVVRTAFRDAHERLPDAYKKLAFSTKSAIVQPSNINDQDTVLPYLRTFKLTVKQTKKIEGLRAWLMSSANRRPDELTTREADLRVKWPPPEQKAGESAPPSEVALELTLPRRFMLAAGLNYGVCIDGPGVTIDKKPYCLRFAVDVPFFQYPNPRRLESTDGQPYNDPQPFFVKKQGDTIVAAVFGVVDPKLGEHVGQLNFAWWNNGPDGRYKTDIVAVEPAKALNQLLEYFDYWYAQPFCGQKADDGAYDDCVGKEGKFRGVKVLAAQMRPPEARELAARTTGAPFHVVVSEAERDRATPNQTAEYPFIADSKKPDDPPHPTFLLVPRPAYDDDKKQTLVQIRNLNVQQMDQTYRYELTGGSNQTKTDAAKTDAPKTSNGTPPCEDVGFSGVVAQAWGVLNAARRGTQLQEPTRAECEDRFRVLTLYAILHQQHADVALLQRRDFFFGPTPPRGNVGAHSDLINRILWKGDFLIKLLVPGSTLKSVIARGATYDAQDSASLSLESEKQRGLVKLGIGFDAERKEYLINGKPLDDTRLYTVATTDYIGLGDTGYPELLTPPVGRSLVPQDFKTLYGIAAVLVHALSANMNPRGNPPDGLTAENYLDHVDDRPFDDTDGLTYGVRLRRWFRPDGNAASFRAMSAPEFAVQNGREWFLSLQKALVSFTTVENNVSEKTRTEEFSSVSPPQAAAKQSAAWSWANQIRGGVTSRSWEFFGSSDLAYSRNSTDRSDLPRLQNYLENRVVLEGGAFWRIGGRGPGATGKAFPHIGPQFSVRADTQAVRPLETFKVRPDGATVDIRRERTMNTALHVGPRLENRQSSLSFGYQLSRANRIDSYDFASFSCPIADKPIADCVTEKVKDGVIAPTMDGPLEIALRLTSVVRHGFYADAKIVIPAAARVSFESQHSYERFRAEDDDNETLTRWRYLISNGLKLKIMQNLSAQPGLDLFFFENQAKRNFLFQWKATLGLNYTFDWFDGNPWTALRRGKS